MLDTTKLAYSPREAATATSLSVRQITRAIAAGDLKSTKIGRRRVIARTDLERYISVGGSSEPNHA